MTGPARVADIDPDKLLRDIVSAGLPDIPGGTIEPADIMSRLGAPDTGGYWVVREVPGGGQPDIRFADGIGVQLDGYAGTRARARWVARTVLAVLVAAHRRATLTPYGHIGALDMGTPFPFPRESDQPANLFRYTATGTAVLRPPTD